MPKNFIDFKTARVFTPLLDDNRYKGIYGGRGSGKSHDRAEAMLERALRQRGFRGICLREVQKSLRLSSKQLIEDKIRYYNLEDRFNILKHEIRTPGNGIIVFQGLQDHTADSIKSIEAFDVGWCEEAHSISHRSLQLLRPTFRKDNSELWFTWNPQNPSDPVDKLFRQEKPPGAVSVQANYEDNPWFPDILREEMEWDRVRDPEKYQHVWRGGYILNSESRVFRNWTTKEFTSPADAIFYFGADWGFSVDPTVLVRCHIVGRTLYIDQEAYKVGCEIDDTPALFDTIEKGQARNWTITADSARPETISYMKRNGYPNIRKAKKGADSLKDGVEFLKNFEIVVHPRCVHTIDELTLYSYKTDKLSGNILPMLDDKKNHVIDSLRYAVESVRHSITGQPLVQEGQIAHNYDGAISATQVFADGLNASYDGKLTHH